MTAATHSLRIEETLLEPPAITPPPTRHALFIFLIALGMIATVAVTFLIGERLADYWRGFLAGLIYLCSCGTFLLGRLIMPEPVFSAFVAGAILCGICGYQRRRFRRFWFLGFWICAALACLTKGVHG